MSQADVSGVPNFTWAWGRVLARGGQPPRIECFHALRGAGIRTVLSLRVDGEPSGYEAHAAIDSSLGDGWHTQSAYHAEEQRSWCHQVRLNFHHIPCPDLVAISPWAVAKTLEVIDSEVQANRPVFVHCIAGIGRTGVITSAWLMSRGLKADTVAAGFLQSFDAWCLAHQVPREERNRYFVSFGAAERWWTLHQLANALGCPITQSFGLEVPSCPETAREWVPAYTECLRPWRQRGQVKPVRTAQ